ncbi:MAG TPA: hypothetical protein VM686_41330 [Polyangiaceae bacterium]|nr:hypothetical protein [Polyangiaceae bacterium]
MPRPVVGGFAVVMALFVAVSCGEGSDDEPTPSAAGSAGSPAGGRFTGGKGGTEAKGGRGGSSSSDAGSPSATGGAEPAMAGSGSDASGGGVAVTECGNQLATKPCQGDGHCEWTDLTGCISGYCDCNAGRWACVQTQTDDCGGVCPPPAEAQCGSSCTGEIQNCQCACGGPNFSGCSCTNGEWACLGCN